MKIACVGDNAVDYYLDVDLKFPGGNPVNVAVYLKELGAQASYIGNVGDDEDGKLVRDGLRCKGVDISHLRRRAGETARSYVRLNDGDRDFVDYQPGVSQDFDLLTTDVAFLREHDMIFSGRWGELVNELKIVSSMPIAFDLGDIWDDEIARRVLNYCDIVFVSVGDLPHREILDLLVSLASCGPKYVIATRGARGSVCYDHEIFHELRLTPVKPVDTLGAGDSFIAGFLYAYLLGKKIPECLESGAKKARQVLMHYGAWECR